ncbi:hypothetical protein [Kitasatospora sp. NBC_00458]|uniref:hypothetical protein n=1 Tax=Kitasatospora sp. NBC_00458 TaxID=2903568 RepID=UPI002E17D9DF
MNADTWRSRLIVRTTQVGVIGGTLRGALVALIAFHFAVRALRSPNPPRARSSQRHLHRPGAYERLIPWRHHPPFDSP